MVGVIDVARHAGVSPATVSRVLNGSPRVSARTRQRVDESIRALGYRVTMAGRALRTSRTGLVLALVPDLANPYYAEIVQALGQSARQHGHELLLGDTGPQADRDAEFARLLGSHFCDGIVSLDPLVSQQLVDPLVHDLAWVACSEFVPGQAVPSVSIDHRLAASDATRLLIDRGHRRIALVNADPRWLFARQRHEGFVQALGAAGLPVDPALIHVAGSIGPDAGGAALRALLALAPARRPTAVFAVADTLAAGILRGCREAGLRVPADLAVVGFDDVPLAALVEPALTTVAQPRAELGRLALGLLLERIAGRMPASVTVPHRIVLRDSV